MGKHALKKKVFVSFSGDRSRLIAIALRELLQNLFSEDIEVWISEFNIQAGELWLKKLNSQLKKTRCGIVCFTKENLYSPWLFFEAGALSTAVGQARVIPYCVDISKEDIGPLTHYQAKNTTPTETEGIVKSIKQFISSEISDNQLFDSKPDQWNNYYESLKNACALEMVPGPFSYHNKIICDKSQKDSPEYDYTMLFKTLKEGDQAFIVGLNLTQLLHHKDFDKTIEELLNKFVSVRIVLAPYKVMPSIGEDQRYDYILSLKKLIQLQLTYSGRVDHQGKALLEIKFHIDAVSLTATIAIRSNSEGVGSVCVFTPKWVTDKVSGDRLYCVLYKKNHPEFYRKIAERLDSISGVGNGVLSLDQIIAQVNKKNKFLLTPAS